MKKSDGPPVAKELIDLLIRIQKDHRSYRAMSAELGLAGDVFAKVARGQGKLSDTSARLLAERYGAEYGFTYRDVAQWMLPPDGVEPDGKRVPLPSRIPPADPLQAARTLVATLEQTPQRIHSIGPISAEGWAESGQDVFMAAMGEDAAHYGVADVRGGCMEPVIPDGALIVFAKREPVIGEVVAVRIGDEVTCKRLTKRNGTWVLSPDAPGYDDLVIRPDEEAKVLGVVVYAVNAVRRRA